MTEREYEGIVADKRYQTRRIDKQNRTTSAALVNAQNELAIRRRRLKDRGFDPESDPIVARWRAEIAGIRRHLKA